MVFRILFIFVFFISGLQASETIHSKPLEAAVRELVEQVESINAPSPDRSEDQENTWSSETMRAENSTPDSI